MLRDEPQPMTKCERCGALAEHREDGGAFVVCRTWGAAVCVPCGMLWREECPNFSNELPASATTEQLNANCDKYRAWTRDFVKRSLSVVPNPKGAHP